MKSVVVLISVALCQLSEAWFYGRPDPGASTQGGVWPLPHQIDTGAYQHVVDPTTFQFTYGANSQSDILDKAFNRYRKWTFPDYVKGSPSVETGSLTALKVTVTNNPSTILYPQFGMDESYTLAITSDKTAILNANEVWGALHGLETFSELVFQPTSNHYRVNVTSITDKPRFQHRGTLVDSSRHFLSLSSLKMHIDVMSQNKMNVFHWHLVDSEAFPYTSTKYPNLSLYGAYTPTHRYSVDDMKEIIGYARLRGVRVVAEFDTPGHMGAWGPGQPGLLSKCYDSNGNNDILGNIIDPSKSENFDFLQNFFTEALALFPDKYMHFGGDEVSSYMLQCWYRNPDVRKWMKDKGFGDDTYKVLDWYFQKLFAIVKNGRVNGTSMIVWQEVLDNNVKAENTIAHVWKGNTIDEAMHEMADVTANGHYAILSSCWYLNYIKYGADWGYVDNTEMQARGMYYQCDPADFDGTQKQKDLVLGGEATMWGEFVDGTNLISRFWPRASAVAERLWSNAADTKSADDAWPRLHEHRCRMMRRGFQVQPPNDPDYCPTFWNPVYNNPDN